MYLAIKTDIHFFFSWFSSHSSTNSGRFSCFLVEQEIFLLCLIALKLIVVILYEVLGLIDTVAVRGTIPRSNRLDCSRIL